MHESELDRLRRQYSSIPPENSSVRERLMDIVCQVDQMMGEADIIR